MTCHQPELASATIGKSADAVADLAARCVYEPIRRQACCSFSRLRDEKLPEVLDGVDARILDLIQHDAALSVAEIAERVGLSSSPCWRRIKRLEDSGVIQKRVTLLDREQLGLAFEVYAEVRLAMPTKDNLAAFEAAVQEMPEVTHCATVTGSMDYVLHIVTRDIHAFDDFLRDKLLSLGLASGVESRIVVRTVKNSTAVPLGLVSPLLSISRQSGAP